MPSDTAGLTLDGTGASGSIADTGGAGTGGFSSWSKSKKTGAAIGGFLILAVGAYFLAKRNSSSSSTSTTPVTVTGATASESGGSDSNNGNVLAGLLSIGSGLGNLGNALSTMKAGNDTVNNYYTTTTTSPAPPGPSGNSSQNNPSSMPGYGVGVAELVANNPSLSTPGANIPGISGYQVSFNGVPL